MQCRAHRERICEGECLGKGVERSGNVLVDAELLGREDF